MRKHNTLVFLTVTIFFALTLGLIGCDSGDLAGTSPNGDDGDVRGQMRVLLTDAPIDNMLEANVTILRVELIDTTSAEIVVSQDSAAFNLLDLQDGITAVLADTTVPFGTYTQIRVVVAEEAHVLWDDSTTSELKVPSGSETGIKIAGLGELTIDEFGDVGEITLDFDAAESFVEAGQSGKVLFKPVIRIQKAAVDDEDDGAPSDTTGSS